MHELLIAFTRHGFEDYKYWKENDKKISKRIDILIESIIRDGLLKGIGKPELLKGELSGYASRRINQEHRIVYHIKEGSLIIIACRYHY